MKMETGMPYILDLHRNSCIGIDNLWRDTDDCRILSLTILRLIPEFPLTEVDVAKKSGDHNETRSLTRELPQVLPLHLCR